MARSIKIIQNQIIDAKNAQAALASLNSPSQVAIWRVWTFIQAVTINLFEQVLDIFKSEIESEIGKAGVGTLPWLRDRILEFQAGDNVVYSNGVIAYPVINSTKNILTRCSVTQDGNRTVTVKVAISEPPAVLADTTELIYYLNQLQFAGTQISVISAVSDKLSIVADIYYNGQFASTIQADVIAALDAYCQNLDSVINFNGTVKRVDIEAAIRAVPGVQDIKFNEVAARPDDVLYASRVVFFNLTSGIDDRDYTTFAGYIIQETTSGHTFTDTLTFKAQ